MTDHSLKFATSESGPFDSPSLVLSGTFTLDSVGAPLELLLRDVGLSWPVRVAPYRQLFQELLDPRSESARNKNGVNALLVRAEDWLPRAVEAAAPPSRSTPEQIVDELLRLLEERIPSWPAGAILGICPSHRQEASPLEERLREGLARIGHGQLRLLELTALTTLEKGDVFDPEGDRLANVPYTPLAFAALARDVARAAHVLRTPRPKVIVLDCDNTLWEGVVGEEGVEGIRISEGRRAFHALLRTKRDAGLLLCLASKNVEEDALEVFRQRRDIGLTLDDFVAWKISWQPKSVTVRELAAELNLGLDSFVFIDDNPVEIAEMQAACPEVLSLQIPADGDWVQFFQQVWPLDVRETTEEDRRRTELYRENLARERFQKTSSSLSDFLKGLELTVDIHPPRAEQMPRAAQLTQRTNQFNFSTVRRTEGELAQALAEGLQARVVEVSDRFGDYGLVGLMLFSVGADRLSIDTFLLSCRVLGRGVEHAMVRHLGEVAGAAGAREIDALFRPTAKNAPAERFLSTWPALQPAMPPGDSPAAIAGEPEQHYLLSAEAAAAFTYDPQHGEPAELEGPGEGGGSGRAPSPSSALKEPHSVLWNRFAREHATPHATLERLQSARQRPAEAPPPLPPRNASEEILQKIWADVLRVEVGVEDDFFALGGTSLSAVTVFARIERELGLRLPLALLVECPTIATLATRLERPRDLASLVVLHEAEERFRGAAPLFLVHDADGETLLYRNLARRIGRRRSVYALQPRADAGAAIVHTRIEEMARHYVAEMRKVQPSGPYLLGGLCAGGVLAFEMARQLEQVSETAHLVALFDAADVEAAPRPHLETTRRLERMKATLREAPLHRIPQVLATKALSFSSYGVESRLKQARERVAVSTLRFCLDHGLPIPNWARGVSVRAVYTAAEAMYKPRHKVKEDIVLFRATSGEGAEEPYMQRYLDPQLGWGPRTAKRVHVFDVPGGHGSMLQEPHVEIVAHHLRTYLEAIQDTAEATPFSQRASS